MRIAQAPRPLPSPNGNLAKQYLLVSKVYDPVYDILLPRGTITSTDLRRAHSDDHVNLLAHGYRDNGFGSIDRAVLAHAMDSVAAMYAASRAAAGAPGPQGVAFAPASGFHHAGHNYCGGFCTFNGLMVAALKLRSEGRVKHVTIIDGDGHYGDGTQDIICTLGLEGFINHVSLGHGPTHGSHWAAQERIAAALAAKTDLVMYQAGADAHKDDPFASGYLTDDEWVARDLTVFQGCRDAGIPVAWNLAGGYNGAKTLALHRSTFASALQVFEPNRQTYELCGPSDTSEAPSPAPSDRAEGGPAL